MKWWAVVLSFWGVWKASEDLMKAMYLSQKNAQAHSLLHSFGGFINSDLIWVPSEIDPEIRTWMSVPHSSTLAWKIPWTEEPGGLQSMGSLRIGHDFTFTFHFHALEKEMATHSSVLAWRIPGMGEPGGLPSMGLHRVGHDWRDLAAAAASLGCDAKDIMGKENTEGKKPNKGLSLGVPLVIIEALFCCSSSETKCRTYLWTIALTLQLFQPSLSGASMLLQPRKPLGKENRCLRKRLLGVWELFTEAEGKFWVG